MQQKNYSQEKKLCHLVNLNKYYQSEQTFFIIDGFLEKYSKLIVE
jgi:hypothetical protein